MSTTFFLVVIVVSLAVLTLLRSPPGSTSFTYRRKPYLLSKAERSFYGVLSQAVAGKALIFSKVRVADVITPQPGLTRSNWQRGFNKISAKHLDFILCAPQSCAVKMAIELDDASHDSAKRQARDTFLDVACQSAGLPGRPEAMWSLIFAVTSTPFFFRPSNKSPLKSGLLTISPSESWQRRAKPNAMKNPLSRKRRGLWWQR